MSDGEDEVIHLRNDDVDFYAFQALSASQACDVETTTVMAERQRPLINFLFDKQERAVTHAQ